MTFTRLSYDEPIAYRIDTSAPRQIDENAMRQIVRSLGQNYADALLDSLYDGAPLCTGDDGLYAVVEWDGRPVAWQRATRI